MIRLPKLTPRFALIALHDLFATALAILTAVALREESNLQPMLRSVLIFLPAFLIYAGAVYYFFGVFETKWRFTSLPDLYNIFRAVTVLAISLLLLDYILVSPYSYGTFFFGKITIVLYWLFQMFFLGSTRIIYRYYRYTRTRHQTAGSEALLTLILGRAADADIILRAVESGAARKILPLGVLSPSFADQGQGIRGVRVLGRFEDLEKVVSEFASNDKHVARLLLMPTAFEPAAAAAEIVMRARRLGIATSRLPSLERGEDLEQTFHLAPINVEDLLLRPSVKIDYGRLESFVKGRSVIVTGGGGSIGSEICDRITHFGANRLLIIENSEPALHAVLERLNAKSTKAKIYGRIADVRDRERMFQLINEFKADIVFHAAALKHVPLLERDWAEGVKTNIMGTVNVADAAIDARVAALVMISTDKAIEPVSILGATKRFAEMYCQALHHELQGTKGGGNVPRLVAVRFGNVLASNGSVVPKFKAQIEAGGPVTVTHPDMVRYFMTIREACDLVITAATHALGDAPSDVSVYVLNMGQPVKILDLAERMIRLAGLEPGSDIEIVFSGMRPGERLNEILFASNEPTAEIGIAGIQAARPVSPSLESMKRLLIELQTALQRNDRTAIFGVFCSSVPDFKGQAHASIDNDE